MFIKPLPLRIFPRTKRLLGVWIQAVVKLVVRTPNGLGDKLSRETRTYIDSGGEIRLFSLFDEEATGQKRQWSACSTKLRTSRTLMHVCSHAMWDEQTGNIFLRQSKAISNCRNMEQAIPAHSPGSFRAHRDIAVGEKGPHDPGT